jgi:hypothetical protein
MIPSKHARSLYFTPRTPWGRYPQNRPAQSPNYLRASQDKPLDSSGKNTQGQGGQTPPNMQGQPLKGSPAAQKTPYDPRPASDRDILRGPGDVAPTVKEQLQRDIDWNRKQGYASNSSLTPPQMIERNKVMRDLFPSKPAQPEANTDESKAGWSFGGEVNFGRGFPKDGPNDFNVKAGMTYGSEAQQKKEEEKKLRNKKPTNETGEEPEPDPTR